MRVLRVAAVVFFACSAYLTGPGLFAQNPVPLINQPLVPASVAPGGKGFTLTVNGTGFVATSSVEWNGQALVTSVVSSKKLKAVVPAANIAKAGTASVTVLTPGVAASNVVYFPVASAETAVSFSRTDISNVVPDNVLVGDFNNDAKPDLIVFDELYPGNGDGTFGSPINLGSCGSYLQTSGDFNGDGKLDIASPFSVCLGNGDGTFTQTQGTLDYYGAGIAPGDFNGDGKLDLIVFFSDFGGSGFDVFLGNGDGTFQIGALYVSSGLTTAVADLNGDGVLDLAIPNYSAAQVGIFLGNGDGTFQSPVNYATGGQGESLVAADFNGDGKIDLAETTYVYLGSTQISVLLGNGDGTFQAQVSYPVSTYSTALHAGDFNGDGKLDLAITEIPSQASNGNAAILLGNGDGSFQSETQFQAGINPISLDLGDFNNDGRLDLVVANALSSTFSIFLQSTVGVTPASLIYTDENVGVPSAPQDVTLTNSATTALNISSITFTGTNPTDFSEINTCGTSLAGGATCTISVTFTPTATGARSATLNVNDDAVGSPQTVGLTGTGTAPVVTLSATSLTFATQLVGTRSATKQVTMTNSGTGTLNITSITASGDFLQQNTCGTSLGVGASCTITVQFFPRQKGVRTGAVTIADDASGGAQTISLSGAGTVVKLGSIGLSFGNQAVGTTSVAVPVTLTNTSGQALTLAGISITGTNASDFAQTNNCGTSVAAHGSCTIRITFTPTALGARSAALSISDNGGGSPQTVGLTGTGI